MLNRPDITGRAALAAWLSRTLPRAPTSSGQPQQDSDARFSFPCVGAGARGTNGLGGPVAGAVSHPHIDRIRVIAERAAKIAPLAAKAARICRAIPRERRIRKVAHVTMVTDSKEEQKPCP